MAMSANSSRRSRNSSSPKYHPLRSAASLAALGQNMMGVWLHHVLPGALPSFPELALRYATMFMRMFCLLDFYSASAMSTWGAQMRLPADRKLDDPIPALAPALMLALWSLSFRLLSRASGKLQLPPRNTPFDR